MCKLYGTTKVVHIILLDRDSELLPVRVIVEVQMIRLLSMVMALGSDSPLHLNGQTFKEFPLILVMVSTMTLWQMFHVFLMI